MNPARGSGLRHGVLLLAAGGSARLGRPKQLLEVAGVTLVRRAAQAALATAPAQALIVLGAHAEAVFADVVDLGFHRVDCPDWQQGLAASLHAGVEALRADIEGALIVLCDQPALTAAHLQALVDAWRAAPERASASTYAGVLGVPALLPRAWFGELAGLAGDRGARDLLRTRRTEVLALPAPDLAADVDHPEDWADRD